MAYAFIACGFLILHGGFKLMELIPWPAPSLTAILAVIRGKGTSVAKLLVLSILPLVSLSFPLPGLITSKNYNRNLCTFLTLLVRM